jgi:L-threonylcarbamoyladenylate synthase
MRSSGLRADTRILALAAPNTISTAASILMSGGVVAIPTDTVYGLAASIQRPDAIDRLYDMKSRPTNKAIPVLVSDLDQVRQVAGYLPTLAFSLAKRYWPGALTIVVEARDGLPEHVTTTDADGRRTVAVRLPNHSVARQVIGAAGGSLAVTSANLSGESPAIDASQVCQLAIAVPDAVIDGGRVSGGTPSTIVSIAGSEVVVLREGAIPAGEIFAFLRGHGYALPGSAV